MSLWKNQIDVSIQDQTTEPFKFSLIRTLKDDITLTAPISIGDSIINVSSGHGFTVGEDCVLFEAGHFNQARVFNVSTNAITLAMPVDKSYTLAAKVIRGNRNLNIDGSATPVEFKFKCYSVSAPIDLLSINLLSQSGSNQPDDGKFSGITALTNGIYVHRQCGSYRKNFGVFSTNKSFKDYFGSVEYTTKGAGGTYGTDVKLDLSEYRVAARIGYTVDEEIVLTVRDDLSSLGLFTAALCGHYTRGEV